MRGLFGFKGGSAEPSLQNGYAGDWGGGPHLERRHYTRDDLNREKVATHYRFIQLFIKVSVSTLTYQEHCFSMRFSTV